jgi:hypothetical protein
MSCGAWFVIGVLYHEACCVELCWGRNSRDCAVSGPLLLAEGEVCEDDRPLDGEVWPVSEG